MITWSLHARIIEAVKRSFEQDYAENFYAIG
jgi:hypothetical protein